MDIDGAVAQEATEASLGGDVKVEVSGYDMSAQSVDFNGRMTYAAWKGLVVMLPCLPAKSPTWQVSG